MAQRKPKITDEWLRDSKARHAKRLEAAEDERDQELRDALAAGYKQADIVRLAGWTRELIRQAMDPEKKAAVRAARAERYARQKGDTS